MKISASLPHGMDAPDNNSNNNNNNNKRNRDIQRHIEQNKETEIQQQIC